VHRFDDLFAEQTAATPAAAQLAPLTVATPSASTPANYTTGQFELENPFTDQPGTADADPLRLNEIEPTPVSSPAASQPVQPGLLAATPGSAIPIQEPRDFKVQTVSAEQRLRDRARWRGASQQPSSATAQSKNWAGRTRTYTPQPATVKTTKTPKYPTPKPARPVGKFRRGLKPIYWPDNRQTQTSDWMPQDFDWDLTTPDEQQYGQQEYQQPEPQRFEPQSQQWQQSEQFQYGNPRSETPLYEQPQQPQRYEPRQQQPKSRSPWQLDQFNQAPTLPAPDNFQPQTNTTGSGSPLNLSVPRPSYPQPAAQHSGQPRPLPTLRNAVPARAVSSRREISQRPAVPTQPQIHTPAQLQGLPTNVAAALRMTRQQRKALIAARGELSGFKGFCPVGLRDNRVLLDSKPQLFAIHGDRTYYFSTPHARLRFMQNPERYAPMANGMDVVLLVHSNEQRSGRLDFCRWYQDQLYLFTTAASMEAFDADPEVYASRFRR
jgi:YHS domain-containing protein